MTTPTDQRIRAAAVRLFTEKGTDSVTLSELAQEANVARGTLYRNIGSMDTLFERVVADLGENMHRRVAKTFADIDDPAARLATGIRLWVRYAHDHPQLGRFAVKFGLTAESLRIMMTGPPAADIHAGVEAGRYAITAAEIPTVISLVLGATISAMWMVLDGHQTWRTAGSATAELVLRATGIDPAEARQLSTVELPDLPTD
ncbi:TetR/AcrR family transcriptional regulator [Nocardia arthritidis]|nr:TetR/AcrR family transcriptional regulator [Nocardia arthritidis]